jgi:hypothetical protein
MDLDKESLDPYSYDSLEEAVQHLEELNPESPEYSIFLGELGERLSSELDNTTYAEVSDYLQDRQFKPAYEVLEQ